MLPTIHSVRFIGTAHATRGASWALHGQDGGQSIDLGDEVLFVFSDTLLSLDPGGAALQAITRNTALFLGNCAALSAESTLDGAMRALRYFDDERGFPREILAPSPIERLAGYRFWPQHGIAVDDRVHLYYLGIHQFEAKSTWGFRPTGSGLARFDRNSGTAERIILNDDWRLWSGADDLRLGTQVVRDGDTLYVFGSRKIDGFTHAIVARVAAADIEQPAAYEYASGDDGWSNRAEEAQPLASTAPEYSVSFNAHLQSYLMCYVDGFRRELLLRFAPRPWGPYSEPLSAGRLPHREQAEVVALAFEHPRFARGGGKTVVISYCQPHFTQNSFVAVTFA